jgi:hypothetical protein
VLSVGEEDDSPPWAPDAPLSREPSSSSPELSGTVAATDTVRALFTFSAKVFSGTRLCASSGRLRARGSPLFAVRQSSMKRSR